MYVCRYMLISNSLDLATRSLFQSAASLGREVLARGDFVRSILTLTTRGVRLSCMEGVTEIATDSPISLNAGRHVVVRELQQYVEKNQLFIWFHLQAR